MQAPTYGTPDRCPVQGDILDSDEPIDFVVANRQAAEKPAADEHAP